MNEGPSSATRKFAAQVIFSVVFLAAGFAVLFFNLGPDPSLDKLASGWVGGVLGFWLQ